MLFCLVVCSELWENCDLYLKKKRKKKSWFSIISDVRGTEMSNIITLSNWQILWLYYLLLLLFINYYLLLLIVWEIKYTAGLCYVNIPGTTCFAHSSCTSLFILIFIKSTVDCIAHFILFNCTFYSLFYFYFIFFSYFLSYSYLYLYIFSCVMFHFLFLFFCTVHWADLSWPTFHYWLYPVWLCMWQIIKNLEPGQ